MKRATRHFSYGAIAVLAALLCSERGIYASDKALPLIHGSRAVALVNGEPVTLAELESAVALRRESTGGAKVDKKETSELVQRLIDVRLAVQEAKKMGLDQLPEIRQMVDAFARTTLREELVEKVAGKPAVPEKEVERLYEEATREWKLIPLLFARKEDAEKMLQRLKAGEKFADLAKSLIADGTATGGGQGQYTRAREINPQIAAVVAKMTPGAVSPVIPLKPAGYALVKLEDVRQAGTPEAKEQARQEALQLARMEALKRYSEGLIKRYAVVHRDLLKRLDFEAKKPGFDALMKDRRVLAEIQGEKPIRVADLADQIRHQLYHGAEQAAANKQLNTKIAPAFEEMLQKRLFRKEALRQGLDKTVAYTRKVKEYENSLVFGSFVQKAVAPDVKLTEEQVKKYYKEHVGDYTSREMMRIWGIAFKKRADAEEAVEKLRKGADFKWLVETAEGQVDKNSGGLLTFDGSLLATADLPENVRKVVSGAKPGDLRVYASPEGFFYALSIQDVAPPKTQPYEEARADAAKKLFDEKLKQALDEYVAKLRAASDVKVFMDR